MKSLKEQTRRVIEICKPRNLFLFSTLAVGSVLAVNSAVQADSFSRFSNSQSIGVHREGNVINASAPSPYKVDDMVFLFQGGPAYYTDKKKPNLTGGLGVDGQPVHITKIGEASVGPVDFEAILSTLWSNKWTAVEIIAGSLLAWSLLAPYSKGAKKTVTDKLVKEAERLKKYILEDTGPFGQALTSQLQEKAMTALDGEVHGGTMFPESKDIINAKNYEQWKQWRVSGVPAGTPSAEVNYYNTLAPRLEKALADKVSVLKQAVVDQMAANLIESLPSGYGGVKKALTDAKSFKLNEEVQKALQTSLDENNIKIDLNEVNRQEVFRPKPLPPTGLSTSTDIIQVKPGAIIKSEYTLEVIESPKYKEFLDGLAARCNSIKKTMSTFISEKTPLWGAVKADFAAEAKITTKLGKPLLFIGSLLLLGYGISNLDKVWIDYKNRVAANEAKAYVDLQNANADKAKKTPEQQNPATADALTYGGKDYTKYTPGFFVLQSTAQQINTAGSRDFRVVYAPSSDKTDQLLSFQSVNVGVLSVAQLTGMPMVGIDKTKKTFVYGMFQDYPIGGYAANHRYQLTISVNSDAKMWGFQIYDLTDNKPLSSKYNMPLPAAWDAVKADPDKFRIYDCAHPR